MVRRALATSTDEHLDHIAAILDGMFRIPGTRIHFGLDFLIGCLRGVGDAFHVVWKANRRNYRLLLREENRAYDENHAWRDVLFLVLLLAGVLCLIAVPLGSVIWLIRSLRVF